MSWSALHASTCKNRRVACFWLRCYVVHGRRLKILIQRPAASYVPRYHRASTYSTLSIVKATVFRDCEQEGRHCQLIDRLHELLNMCQIVPGRSLPILDQCRPVRGPVACTPVYCSLQPQTCMKSAGRSYGPAEPAVSIGFSDTAQSMRSCTVQPEELVPIDKSDTRWQRSALPCVLICAVER